MFIVMWSKTARGLCFHVIIQYQLGGIKQEINVDVCRGADEGSYFQIESHRSCIFGIEG
jgi:hypothetical protein